MRFWIAICGNFKILNRIEAYTCLLYTSFKDVRSNLDCSSMSFSDLERGLSKAQARLEKYGDAEEKALLTGRDTGRSWENIQYQIAKALNDVIGFENALERIDVYKRQACGRWQQGSDPAPV